MKFLHISDIHFDPLNDGRATKDLRDKFKAYVREKNISDIDELFFTGDFRHAARQKEQDMDVVAKNSVDFLRYIAECVGITDDEHIHIVPGNHDIDRYKTANNKEEDLLKQESNGILKKIYNDYKIVDGKFEGTVNNSSTLDYLYSRFDFFEKCVSLLNNEVWKNLRSKPIHQTCVFEDYSIIYLNTAIASGCDEDKHNLLIGNKDFYEAVRRTEGKIIIILAHNPLWHLADKEQVVIKHILNDNKAPVLWFCGDAHENQYDNSYNIACITVGCMIQESGTEASFCVGELSNNSLVEINAHGYSAKHSNWQPLEALTKRIRQSIPKQLQPHYRRLMNKYFSIIIILISVLGISILLSEFKRKNSKYVESSDMAETIEGHVEYTYEDLTPLYLADYEFNKNTFPENHEFQKKFTNDGYDKGCVLKAYLTNKNEYSVTVAGSTLVVDEITAIEEPKPVILGYVDQNQLSIYVLNDGNQKYEGSIEIGMKYYNESIMEQDYLEEDIVSEILNSKSESTKISLEAGEIVRIKKFDVSFSKLDRWMKENKKNPGIYVIGKCTNSVTGEKDEFSMGCLYAADSGRVYFLRGQGDEYENTIVSPVIIDINGEVPKEYPIAEGYNIDSMSAKNIQMILLPKKSCKIKFHGIIEIAGKDSIYTSTFEEKIIVPLYKNGADNLYSDVVSYLVTQNIDHYYYNEDSFVQSQIAYYAEHMLKNEDETLNIPYNNIEQNLDYQTFLDEDQDDVLQDEQVPDFDSYGEYGVVLQEYYNVAKNHFFYGLIEEGQYVNKGAYNFCDQEKYSVYYQLRDLSNDGVPELIISINEKEAPKNIVDIYSMENKIPVRIIEDDQSVGYRCRYYICRDNRIKNENSGGALNSTINYYLLEADNSQIVLSESYVYDGENGDSVIHTDSNGTTSNVSIEIYNDILEGQDVDFEGQWENLYEGKSVHYIE